MWYMGAQLTARDLGWRAARMTRRNFLSRKALKSLETAKESRSRRRGSPRPVFTRRDQGWGSSDPWTRLWRSPEAERAPPPSLESGEARSAVKSKGNFPPRKALKSLETAKDSRPPGAPSRTARCRRIRPVVKAKGNFPPRKALKSLETAKESREPQRPMGPDEGDRAERDGSGSPQYRAMRTSSKSGK